MYNVSQVDFCVVSFSLFQEMIVTFSPFCDDDVVLPL